MFLLQRASALSEGLLIQLCSTRRQQGMRTRQTFKYKYSRTSGTTPKYHGIKSRSMVLPLHLKPAPLQWGGLSIRIQKTYANDLNLSSRYISEEHPRTNHPPPVESPIMLERSWSFIQSLWNEIKASLFILNIFWNSLYSIEEKKYDLAQDALQLKLLCIEEQRLKSSYNAEDSNCDLIGDQGRQEAIMDIHRRIAEHARYIESQGVVWERNVYPIQNRDGFYFDNRLRKKLGLFQQYAEITIGWDSKDNLSLAKDCGKSEAKGFWTLVKDHLGRSS